MSPPYLGLPGISQDVHHIAIAKVPSPTCPPPYPGLPGMSQDVPHVPTSPRTSRDIPGCPPHSDHQGPKSHMSPPHPGLPGMPQDVHHIRVTKVPMSPPYPGLPVPGFLGCQRVCALVGHSVIHSWHTHCIRQKQ